jgi:hypothetical protein
VRADSVGFFSEASTGACWDFSRNEVAGFVLDLAERQSERESAGCLVGFLCWSVLLPEYFSPPGISHLPRPCRPMIQSWRRLGSSGPSVGLVETRL